MVWGTFLRGTFWSGTVWSGDIFCGNIIEGILCPDTRRCRSKKKGQLHLLLAYKWFWAGWSDQDSEGTFVNLNTGEPLTDSSYARWGLGEPNGNSMENCATIRPVGYWNDNACFEKTCSFCEFGEPPIYIMRGNKF